MGNNVTITAMCDICPLVLEPGRYQTRYNEMEEEAEAAATDAPAADAPATDAPAADAADDDLPLAPAPVTEVES